MGSVAASETNKHSCDSCLKEADRLDVILGDRLCLKCQTVFWVAEVLLNNHNADEPNNEALREEIVIPTLVFAKIAGGSRGWDELAQAESGAQYRGVKFLEMMYAGDSWRLDRLDGEYEGWEFAGELEGVPLARVKPFELVPEHHPETRVLKEVRIQVLSSGVGPKTIRDHYSDLLVEQGARWSESNHGLWEHNFSRGFLELRVGAGAELCPSLVQGLGGDPLRHPAWHFPPPDVVAGVYGVFLGSVHKRTKRGYAYALDLYGKPRRGNRSGDYNQTSVIRAFVAWHIAEGPGDLIPAKERVRVSRILNRHLLEPCGLKQLPEDRWERENAEWRDIETRHLWRRFVRLYAGGVASPAKD